MDRTTPLDQLLVTGLRPAPRRFALLEAVQALPDGIRPVVDALFLQGADEQLAADELGVDVDQVRQLREQGLRALRVALPPVRPSATSRFS